MHRNPLIRGPAAWLLAAALFLPAIVGLAGMLERDAIQNWDLMGYVGCLLELETDDPVEIHRRVVGVVETEVPESIRPRLLAGDQLRHHEDWAWGREVATDPQAFAAQLDWYRPRVGFTALLAIAHHGFGLPPLDSVREVIDASFMALGVLLWAVFGRRLGPWPGGALALAVMASQPLVGVAKLHTADLTATVPLLGGLWALLECRRAWPTLLLFLAAILVRPDYAITCVAILLFAAAVSSHSTGRIAPNTSRGVLAGAAAAAAALYVALGAWGQHPGWTALFWFTFVEKRVDPTEARFDLGEYVSAFADQADFIGSTSAPLFVALAVCLCAALPRRSAEERRLHGLTLALTTVYLLRFLAFPAIWDRVWLPLELWVLIALVITLDARRRPAQAARSTASQP